MKNNKNKKQNGFTLVEVLLIVLFISLTSLGIYMMQRKASEEVTINREQEYILSLFEKIDKASSAMSRFENISLEALKESGYEMKSTGFNLVSVTSPSLTRLEATYSGLSNKECSMFVSSLVNFNQSHSARVNNIPISTKADPRTITRECSADSNEVVIVRENNIFGVVLNTSLDGINNPLTGQNLNGCPLGVCSSVTPVSPPAVTPVTVNVNKPTVTVATGNITPPVFTPGPLMNQPVTVPPILTPGPGTIPTTPTGPGTPTTPGTPTNPGTPGTVTEPSPGTVGSTATNVIATGSATYPAASSSKGYDFFAPTDFATKDYPVMIMIHGGGWMGGSNADNLVLNQHMAGRGYKVFAPTYTLTQQFPTQMNDISAFTTWLKNNKASFGIVNAPISIGGGSAGAHLALFEATKGIIPFKCVFDVAGPVDVDKIKSDLATVNYVGYPDQKQGMADLVDNILANVAPTLAQQQQGSVKGTMNAQRIFALHNENDMLVPFIQTQRLASTYGGQVTVIKLPFNSDTFDGGHNLGGSIQKFGIPAFDTHLANYCK